MTCCHPPSSHFGQLGQKALGKDMLPVLAATEAESAIAVHIEVKNSGLIREKLYVKLRNIV